MSYFAIMALASCVRAKPVASEPPRDTFSLAVTIDDLPWVSVVPEPGGVAAGTDRLLAHLAARDVPAAGFVNCDKPHQELLSVWLDHGHTLGNHTASHLDIDKVSVDAWLEDARSCHDALTTTLGAPPRYFRYPYLRNGKDEATRDAARDALLRWEQQLARVTIDNHEWKIAFLYGEAMAAGERSRADALAAFYVEHLRAATAYYRQETQRRLGREPAHILLLHANWLAADHLGQVLDALAEDGAVFVSLEEALADPLYAMPDQIVTPAGTSWLHHAAPDPTDGDFEDLWWNKLKEGFQRRSE